MTENLLNEIESDVGEIKKSLQSNKKQGPPALSDSSLQPPGVVNDRIPSLEDDLSPPELSDEGELLPLHDEPELQPGL